MLKSCSEVCGRVVDLVEDKLLANTCLSENGSKNLLTSAIHKCGIFLNIEIYSGSKNLTSTMKKR